MKYNISFNQKQIFYQYISKKSKKKLEKNKNF